MAAATLTATRDGVKAAQLTVEAEAAIASATFGQRKITV